MTSAAPRASTVTALALLATLAARPQAAAQQAGLMIGDTAPEAVVENLDGNAFPLSQITKGKPVLLEFWATWCPICKQLEPVIAAARAKHADVTFVSVGVKDHQTPQAQKSYAKAHRLGGQFVFDEYGEAVKAFAVPHTSFVVVIDQHGTVVYTGVGPDQDIEAALGHLMAAAME
jgi:thiol-disulfide isomerase/thioredoxin